MSKISRAWACVSVVAGFALTFGLAWAQDKGPCLDTQPCTNNASPPEASVAPADGSPATVNCHGTHGLAVFKEPGAVNIIATLTCGDSVTVLKTGIGRENRVAEVRTNEIQNGYVYQAFLDLLVSGSGTDKGAVLASADNGTPQPTQRPLRDDNTATSVRDIPSEPGLYAVTSQGLIKIEGQAVSFVRSGSRLVSTVTVGIKSEKGNLQILGTTASHTLDSKPEFLFKTAPGNEAAGGSAGDLVLLRLRVHGERRQVELGARGFGRESRGPSIRSQIQCLRREIEPGLYRVIPAEALTDGEYAFYLYRGYDLPPLIYDFGAE